MDEDIEVKNPKTKEEIIKAGLCPSGHETQERVCKGCYEELLKKYKSLMSKGKSKSPWQTW